MKLAVINHQTKTIYLIEADNYFDQSARDELISLSGLSDPVFLKLVFDTLTNLTFYYEVNQHSNTIDINRSDYQIKA